ncbi:hypothetical protein U2G91_26705 (plasmid) [Rhodococcoides fascians]|uniref:hypothetical protein n=1 Tax=Rhodococcoides fascians TaxID=1828 RepID=UPI002ACEDD19|nr:hypothetical protein [Rhodococcus fascians]WQH31153.1 hypothetical protein U2G91_26705 [Rhodococcus fascians]
MVSLVAVVDALLARAKLDFPNAVLEIELAEATSLLIPRGDRHCVLQPLPQSLDAISAPFYRGHRIVPSPSCCEDTVEVRVGPGPAIDDNRHCYVGSLSTGRCTFRQDRLR